MTAVRESGPDTAAQIGYDASGRRSSLLFGASGIFTSSASYGYDPVSRLSTLARDLAGSAHDQSLGFSYNAASQVVTRSASNDAYVSNTAYDVSRNYTVNGLNQYTAAGPATLLYDANGNLTSDGGTSFVYDAENRLVSASGTHNATLQYDPHGRLARVTGANGTTWFLYDGDRLLEEYDGAGTRLRAYAHGPGQPAPAEAGEPLVWYELTGGAVQRVLHADHQGSVIGIADSSGNALAVNAYDPWGIPNAGNQGRFGYTGQIWIPELGMWHYKARIYSPTLGRFLQMDPVGYEDQMNLYAYVGNDPVNYRDPSGECTTLEDGTSVGLCAAEQIGYDVQPDIDAQIANPNSIYGELEAQLVKRGEITEFSVSERNLRGLNISNPDEVERTDRGFRITLDPSEYQVQATGPGGETIENYTMSRPEVLEHTGGHVQGMINGQGPRENESYALAVENKFRARTGAGVTRTQQNREAGAVRTGRRMWDRGFRQW